MRAVFFHQNLEYKLEVPKDGFEQGDTLNCTLSLTNRNSSTLSINELRLDLAIADTKDVREKKEENYEIVARAEIKCPFELAAQATQSFPWTYPLDANCCISDKSQSLYVLYGGSAAALGLMPLNVQAHAHIQSILKTMETSFQFVLKGQKSNKGWVEAKLKPPSARRFMLVNELLLSLRFEEERKLALRFVFNVKKFDTGSAKIGVKKGKIEVEKTLEERQYLMPGGFIKQEAVEACIEEAISSVASAL